MTLAAGKTWHFMPCKAAIVVLRVNDGDSVTVQDTALQKKGDYVFILWSTPLDFKNPGQAEARLAMLN